MICASFKYLLGTSQKTPMNVAITFNTTVSTRQRNHDTSLSACEKGALLVACLFCFLLGLFFNPGDGDNVFFRSVGRLLLDYAALYPK
jgi:hypothetical protein